MWLDSLISLVVEGIESGVAIMTPHNPAFDSLAWNVWLIWILPFIGAMLAPAFA